jgi:hypothetical protein
MDIFTEGTFMGSILIGMAHLLPVIENLSSRLIIESFPTTEFSSVIQKTYIIPSPRIEYLIDINHRKQSSGLYLTLYLGIVGNSRARQPALHGQAGVKIDCGIGGTHTVEHIT